MLDFVDEIKTNTLDIDLYPCNIVLPDTWSNYFEQIGPVPQRFDDCRRFRRWNYRVKALLRRHGEIEAILTKDISRMGIAFLHHQQLFPKETVEVLLPDGRCLLVHVSRCARIQDDCFECGAIFAFESLGPHVG